MSILDEIAQAIFLNRPAMFHDIRQKLCKHDDAIFTDDGELVVCHECGKKELNDNDAIPYVEGANVSRT